MGRGWVGGGGSAGSGPTWLAFVVHMEVFGRAGTGVLPKQQVVDGQLTPPVVLTLRQQLLEQQTPGSVTTATHS